MPATGQHLEAEGKRLIEGMGLRCFSSLGNVKLNQINPSSAVSAGENLEFDYFVPHGSVCLIGEITARSNPSGIKAKYSKFRDQFNFFNTSPSNSRFDPFQIPEEQRHLFSEVTTLRGFFISTKLQADDLNLSPVSQISVYYKNDWEVLKSFASCIYDYARFPFLEKLGVDVAGLQAVASGTATSSVMIQNPYREPGRLISEGTGPADVFVFQATPDELLPLAKVFRRDELPSAASNAETQNYQRPLVPSKLRDIRSIIHNKPNFMFPNSIIAVLSADAHYQESNATLYLPKKYGSLTIVDGQHRLFSYAGPSSDSNMASPTDGPIVPADVRKNAKILVMGIKFADEDSISAVKYAAKTFVEINRNHTRIQQRHLYLIDFDVLGSTTGEALAGKVILNCNSTSGAAQGLFITNQRSTGILPAVTIIEELSKLLNIETRISACNSEKEIQGFHNLLGQEPSSLEQPDKLIDSATNALKRYFSHLKTTFDNDWPTGTKIKSSFRRAKFFAALIRMFDTMLTEGKNWNEVESALQSIKSNVLTVRSMAEYDSVLFTETVQENIPTWRDTITELHNFLSQNRFEPTKKQTSSN